MIAFTFAASTAPVLLLLYNIFIVIYGAALRLAATWNPKARQWVQGRKDIFKDLSAQLPPKEKLIWMHCASAGEFEQGKPLIEELKKTYPHHKVLVSFFSPSGFQAGKKYQHADFICFLPEDTADNAARFLDIIRPSLALFVKYDFWFHHLNTAASRKVPLLLVSSIFREEQAFFKWYGGLHRRMLGFFTRLFVQDGKSAELLKRLNIQQVTVAGDTRFDRVAAIAASSKEFPLLKAFAEDEALLVAGSTWPDDEELMSGASLHCKMVIAPHEITDKKVESVQKILPAAIRYSQADLSSIGNAKALVIDNYGMLSSLYRYATISYIGGGFNKSGIHNTLEAAVWGCPVIFGPNYQKFREARELVERGAAFPVNNKQEFEDILALLLADRDKQENAGKEAAAYVRNNTGASGKIVQFIQENRLLTT